VCCLKSFDGWMNKNILKICESFQCCGCKRSRPILYHCVDIYKLYFSGQKSCIVCCLHLKIEFRSSARGRQWCGIFYHYWWTASIKPSCCFPMQTVFPGGFPFHQLYFKHWLAVKLLSHHTAESTFISVEINYGVPLWSLLYDPVSY